MEEVEEVEEEAVGEMMEEKAVVEKLEIQRRWMKRWTGWWRKR